MTVLSTVLIIGWREDWRVIPLSVVFKTQSDREIYSTASIGIGSATNFADTVLQLPIIILFLFAIVLLSAFYLWLHGAEMRLTKANR